MKEAFLHLGFPDYFRVELAIAKFIGVVLLMIPFRTRIKEWAYAGFAITFISAFIGHAVSGDPVQYSSMPVLFFIPLAISYIAYHKMHQHIGSIEIKMERSDIPYRSPTILSESSRDQNKTNKPKALLSDYTQ